MAGNAFPNINRQPAPNLTARLNNPDVHVFTGQPDVNPMLDRACDGIRARVGANAIDPLANEPNDTVRLRNIRLLLSRVDTIDRIYENPNLQDVQRTHTAGLIEDQDRDELNALITRAQTNNVPLNSAPRSPQPHVDPIIDQLRMRIAILVNGDFRNNRGDRAMQRRSITWAVNHQEILRRIQQNPTEQFVWEISQMVDLDGNPLIDFQQEFLPLYRAVRGVPPVPPPVGAPLPPPGALAPVQQPGGIPAAPGVPPVPLGAPQQPGIPRPVDRFDAQNRNTQAFLREFIVNRAGIGPELLNINEPRLVRQANRLTNARDGVMQALQQQRRFNGWIQALHGRADVHAAQENLRLSLQAFEDELAHLMDIVLEEALNRATRQFPAQMATPAQRQQAAQNILRRLGTLATHVYEHVDQQAGARMPEQQDRWIGHALLERWSEVHPLLRLGVTAAATTGLAVGTAVLFPAILPAAAAAVAKVGIGNLAAYTATRRLAVGGLALGLRTLVGGFMERHTRQRRDEAENRIFTEMEGRVNQNANWLSTPDGRIAAMRIVATDAHRTAREMQAIGTNARMNGLIATILIGVGTGSAWSVGEMVVSGEAAHLVSFPWDTHSGGVPTPTPPVEPAPVGTHSGGVSHPSPESHHIRHYIAHKHDTVSGIAYSHLGLTAAQAEYALQHSFWSDPTTGHRLPFSQLNLIQPGHELSASFDTHGKPHLSFRSHGDTRFGPTVPHPHELHPASHDTTHHEFKSAPPPDNLPIAKNPTASPIDVDPTRSPITGHASPGPEATLSIDTRSGTISGPVWRGMQEVPVQHFYDFLKGDTAHIQSDVVQRLSEYRQSQGGDLETLRQSIERRLTAGRIIEQNETIGHYFNRTY